MSQPKIYTMAVNKVYPHYVTKVEKKGRTQDEVDEVISWLTGYDIKTLHQQLNADVDFETFFAEAPRLNPSRRNITGVICGVRVENMEESLMKEIRYLYKLIDDVAKGKSLATILDK